MSYKGRMSRGTNFHGGASGQETTAFDRALHSVYDRATGKSTGRNAQSHNEGRWVKNPRTGTRVGMVKDEAGMVVFERQAKESAHKLRMMGGAWALELDLIHELQRIGVNWVRINTADRTLCVPLMLFLESGKTLDLKYGIQMALPESVFSDRVASFQPKPQPKIQMDLFGGSQ